MTEPLLVQLATSLARPVGESERKRARLHLLDWLACVAGARRAELFAGDALQRATLLGNVLEMDDVHRRGRLHPGPVIWPAVIGAHGAMDNLLDAAVRGYEAMIAVGETFDDEHYAHFHPTATAGVFGAAAASASQGAMHSALGFAGSVSGGLWQMRHEAGAGKQWHVLHAVATGRRAAAFAAMGNVGPTRVLEGPQGLYAATCAKARPMRLGTSWKISEVSFKPWAACRHAHPAIDAAMELRAKGMLRPPFHVETYADALVFCDRPSPTSEIEAKFSLQHALAVVADGRNAVPGDFTMDAVGALAHLRAQVDIVEDSAISARYAAHFGARVNGLELIDTRGDPERPIDEATIVNKMSTLARWGGLQPAEAERARAVALEGNDAEAISTLLESWLA
mgnify:CR=1 FL=1